MKNSLKNYLKKSGIFLSSYKIGLKAPLKDLPRHYLQSLVSGFKYFRKTFLFTINKNESDIKGILFVLVLPVFAAILILIVAAPAMAQLGDQRTRLLTYVLSNDLDAGIEADEEGYGQVYFVFEGDKFIITDSRTSKGGVQVNHEDVVWIEQVDGLWQIFRYNIATNTTTQFTFSGNNVNPKVSGGKVVWEGIRQNGNWQIYVYDGTILGPITSGDMAANPQIDGDYIVFARKDINNQWKSQIYKFSQRKTLDIAIGIENRNPDIEGGEIFLGIKNFNRRRFPLNVDDLFLLDLPPLSTDSISTSQVREELQGLIDLSQQFSEVEENVLGEALESEETEILDLQNDENNTPENQNL
jgi:beta propeller repeat protein